MKFRIAVLVEDDPCAHALRGLAFYSQKGTRTQKSLSVKGVCWRSKDEPMIFIFTHEEYKETFLREAERLLPRDAWRIVE